jgi:hypothetical protein
MQIYYDTSTTFLQLHAIVLLCGKFKVVFFEYHNGESFLKGLPFFCNFVGIFAEPDKSLLVKKLKKLRDKVRKEKGKCEGRKSYKETDDGKVILQEIRRLRRKNKGKVRRTFNEVAVELNKQGYLNVNGEPFTGNTVRGIMHRAKKR